MTKILNKMHLFIVKKMEEVMFIMVLITIV